MIVFGALVVQWYKARLFQKQPGFDSSPTHRDHKGSKVQLSSDHRVSTTWAGVAGLVGSTPENTIVTGNRHKHENCHYLPYVGRSNNKSNGLTHINGLGIRKKTPGIKQCYNLIIS